MEQMEQQVQAALSDILALEPTQKYSLQALTELLAVQINRLLQTNFEQLVNLLYRIDVSEKALKQLLGQHPKADAGYLIATLIIERQLQKIKTRQQYKTNNDFDGAEKW
jgi:hypothetical protein